MSTPLATAILRQGRLKKTFGHLYYTQEVLNQNHATDLLHEMVNFKNQQNFTAVLVKQKKTMVKNNTILDTLQLSVKIKETPRAFTAVGVLITHYENNQNKEHYDMTTKEQL